MFQVSSPTAAVRRVCISLAAATCVLLASAAYAQRDSTLPMSGALKPAPLTFDSVLSRYKPMTDQKLGAWREANDNVGQIGGWRTYLKEVQQPEVTTPAPVAAPVRAPAAAPTAAPAATPDLPRKPATPSVPTAPNPHAGHGAKL